MRGARFGGWVRAALLAGTALSSAVVVSPAWAVNVATETELRNAIFASNGGGDSNINITGNITLTRSLPMITSSVTVTGNNNTIDAANTGRVIFAQNGTVAVSNLTINNAVAQGGAGGTGAAGAGGGLGAGAAVFVNNTANVTLTNVVVGNASATGGAGGAGSGTGNTGGGGGGGLGGAGGSAVPAGGSVFSVSGGGGGGYAGTGGSVLNGGTGGGGGGGEFGAGGTTNGTSGGSGGGGQQGAGGASASGGGGGGGASVDGGAASASTGGAGGGAQGGAGGDSFNPGSPAAASLGGGGGGGALDQGGSGALSGGGGGTGGGTPSGPGGTGGVGGGGGGGGSGQNSRGGAGGDFGGGAGAGVSSGQGGAGGFGGGGGSPGTTFNGVGGAGGFGGGGGGGGVTAGAGGTLGGTGGTGADAGGGGGAALGGAIFVRDGGSLTISGGTLGGTYSATGGAAGSGGTGATAGQAQGSTMFLHGTGSTSFGIASGTQTLAGSDALAGSGGLSKSGAGTLALTGGNANYSGAVSATGGTVAISAGNSLGTGGLTLNGGTLRTDGAVTVGNAVTLGSSNGTVDTNGNNATLSVAIGGTGGLIKNGAGTLTLGGTNTYSGGTTVSGGTLRAGAANTLVSTSAHTVASGATLDLDNFNQTVGSLAGAGGVTLGSATLTAGGDNSSTIYSGVLSGTGGLAKNGTGTMTLSGNNTYGGATAVNGGRLVVNGSITSNVTVGASGSIGGSGTISGDMASSGTLAPGNSIGTLNVTGNFTQNGGTYQVEVNPSGQSDRIAATGTATINGGTVQVIAEQGSYARSTTYTILTATGGVTGAYSTVTANFAFLRPSLSYTANSVLLDLVAVQNAFAAGAQTPNQRAVGTALDLAVTTATGDFVTVLDAMYALNTQQGPAALIAISGVNYGGFATGLVQTAQLFMSNFSGQAGGANRVGGGTARANGNGRIQLADACDVACDTVESAKWGAWGGAIGAAGSVGGTSNAGTTTYNAGGFAAGIDRQVAPELLLGFTLGYASGNQWTQGLSGRGNTDTVQAGLYAGYLKGPVYVDALAAYAYSSNRMTRQIAIPGLAARTATGSTGANQFFGQVETGYRVDLGGLAEAYVTPFVRLQGSTATQNGFTESGAQSLNLTVASQTTNSLRSVLGAQLGGAMDMGWREKLAVQFKLGWSHEFASTDRPVTASFLGAPAIPFTTYGAAPERDGVVVGFNATTAIGESSSVYFRYEGEISGDDNMHAGTIGVRFTW